MAEPLKPYEIETLLRSAAMAPLASETVRRVLEAHRDALARDADLEALIARLRPAWEEVRELLDELAVGGVNEIGERQSFGEASRREDHLDDRDWSYRQGLVQYLLKSGSKVDISAM